MILEQENLVGFACAYTPLALIHAAGFTPFRVLPNSDAPDQAGQLLHDNLCPHIKRILDRVMDNRLPDLKGMVFMNSCDAMRRLTDAFRVARPETECVLVDLPTTPAKQDAFFFACQLRELSATLEKWGGQTISMKNLAKSLGLYEALAHKFEQLRSQLTQDSRVNSVVPLQDAYLQASCQDPATTLETLDTLLSDPGQPLPSDGVPIFLFGNVIPETEAFSLLEACGVRISGDDLCTGSRLFTPINIENNTDEDLYIRYAQGLLSRPACARTLNDAEPGKFSRDIAEKAQKLNVKGVFGYTAKFCDPYIARLPSIRSTLKHAGMPLLLLEGDCTTRSLGQHKTRIEAFIEMLR